jgi:hypothetical protein
MRRALVVLGACVLAGSAAGAELAGVTMPDTVTVEGHTLKLNGLGLRTKLFFKIYVGGLYLETPTADAVRAVDTEQVKRVVMHFLYKSVRSDQLVDAWKEGFEDNTPSPSAALSRDEARFEGWMADVRAGDEIVVTYVPETGTSVTVAGKEMGTIPGADFMRALFRVWLGDHPPTRDLRAGMLGKRA